MSTNTMKTLPYQVVTNLEAALENTAILSRDRNWSLRKDYSGRYMYGEKCFGIVADSPTMVYFALGIFSKSSPTLAADLMDARREDNMGKQFIVYFPGFSVD